MEVISQIRPTVGRGLMRRGRRRAILDYLSRISSGPDLSPPNVAGNAAYELTGVLAVLVSSKPSLCITRITAVGDHCPPRAVAMP